MITIWAVVVALTGGEIIYEEKFMYENKKECMANLKDLVRTGIIDGKRIYSAVPEDRKFYAKCERVSGFQLVKRNSEKKSNLKKDSSNLDKN